LEDDNSELVKKVGILQTNLRCNNIKINVYNQVFEHNNINIKEYVEDDDSNLNVYQYQNIKIFKKEKGGVPFKIINVNQNVQTVRKPKKSKESKECIESKESNEIKENDFTLFCSEIENQRNTIQTDTKYANRIRNFMNNLYNTDMNFEQYKTYITPYIDKVLLSLEKRTKLTASRKRNIYNSIIPPIYSRICQFTGFTDIKLETDDVCLYLNTINNVYKDSADINQLLNHSICLKTGTEYIHDYMRKRKDIRYFGEEYKFYILNNNNENEGNNWILDNRLISTYINLSHTVLLFAISLYRIIHNDIFKDNLIRSDDMYNPYPELCQLRKTIVFVSDKRVFNDFLIECVKDKLMCVATDTDIFDIKSDDQEKLNEYNLKQTDKNRFIELSALYDDFTLEKLLTIIK
jgi:hypothetical protein